MLFEAHSGKTRSNEIETHERNEKWKLIISMAVYKSLMRGSIDEKGRAIVQPSSFIALE